MVAENRNSLPEVKVYDNLLDPSGHQAVYSFLKEGNWSYGAYSSDHPLASRYWYKHFAGYERGGDDLSNISDRYERVLSNNAPILGKVWLELKKSILNNHTLARCYANASTAGLEGGVHKDSNISTHLTAIYYPHEAWSPDFGGETVFFNEDCDDIIACVYPKPNRLVVFPGTIAHCARPLTRVCTKMRITLMFKTAGETLAGV